MPYELLDLVVDRVDLVDEGANSAAFIELYKRKEKSEPMDFNEILSKMKPEHAEVVSKAFEDKDEELLKARKDLADTEEALNAANEALAKANEELETLKSDKPEDEDEDKPEDKPEADDEEALMKSMPDGARELFLKMRAQKEAAEEQVRKAAEREAENAAIAKAASLKAIPVEQAKLVGVIKSCSPDMLEILTLANDAIEAAVLGEVGKNKGNGAAVTAPDAWSQIEKRADEIAQRDSITKEKAISVAVQENPDLYRQYLEGGAN